MSALEMAQLEPEYLRLRAYHVAARAWLGQVAGILTAAQLHGANSTLNSAAGWLDRLAPTGDLGRGVIAGTFEASRWVNIANAQGAQIQNAWAAASPSDTLDDLWTDVVVPTAQQTADVVKQAAAATPGILTSLAVLAVVYLLLKVTR